MCVWQNGKQNLFATWNALVYQGVNCSSWTFNVSRKNRWKTLIKNFDIETNKSALCVSPVISLEEKKRAQSLSYAFRMSFNFNLTSQTLEVKF